MHCAQLHTTGIKFTSNTKVKRTKSKRDLNADTSAAASKQLPPLSHPPITNPPTARKSRADSAHSPGVKRGSVVPLQSATAITSTDLQMADDLHKTSKRHSLKHTASERKAGQKAKRKGGKAETETEWVYEEKELKIAICCVIS